MALHWTQDARRRVAPRTLEDLEHRGRSYTENWSWLRSFFTSLAWNELESPPATVTDEQLDAAVKATTPGYSAMFLGKRYGIDRVFKILLASKDKDKALTPTLARELVLHAGDKLDEIVEAAAAVWPNADATMRKTLAYAFFTNDAWRKEALSEILKTEGFSNEALALCKTEDEVRELLSRKEAKQVVEFCEIVAAIEEAALPILLELAPKVRGNNSHLSMALAMSVFKETSVAEYLAAHLSHPTTRGVIGAYFQRFPKLAEEVLPAASKGASRNAALVKALFIKVCGAPAEEIEIAPEDDPAIPEVLRSPPWTKPRPPAPKIEIDLAKYPRRLVIPEGAGKAALQFHANATKSARPMTDEEKRAYIEASAAQAWINDWVVEGKIIPDDLLLEQYNAGKRAHYYNVDELMIVKFGDAALPGLMKESGFYARISKEVLRGCDIPELAVPFANIAMQVATPWTQNPWVWFDAQPRAATYGLLAAINDANMRPVAEIVLRRIGRDHRDAVLSVAEKVGQRAWVTQLLDRDPHLDYTTPGSIEMHPATRPRLKDGRGLPDRALKNLYAMCTFSSLEDPYIGFEDVRAACDAQSLSDMAWDLAAAAEGSGHRRTQRNYGEWTRWTLVHFANDELVRRLTPALKHAGIYRALEGLAINGHHIALMEIATAVEREDPQAVTSMTRIAERAGLTVAELVETILPTTKLSSEGRTKLEYGARTLEVGFDTTLAPVLFHDDKKLASLPRAKKSDDPIQIRLAKERWDELKEDVRTIANLRCKTVETALRNGETFPAARFMKGWAHHPLGKHLGRGIVWGVKRGGALITFRVAEDSTLADADDATLVLKDDEEVLVPHPLDLGAQLGRWSQIFVDYGLIQPVHQLDRAAMTLAAGEENQAVIERTLSPMLGWNKVNDLIRAQSLPKQTSIEATYKWEGGKTWASSIKCSARDANNQPIPIAQIEPRDRHELLFAMRLILEAT